MVNMSNLAFKSIIHRHTYSIGKGQVKMCLCSNIVTSWFYYIYEKNGICKCTEDTLIDYKTYELLKEMNTPRQLSYECINY